MKTIMTFQEFCKKTAENLGLEVVPVKEGDRRATTYMATQKNPHPKQHITFDDLTIGGNTSYIAEVFNEADGHYVGTIGMEAIDKAMFEHYETGVSPEGKYDANNCPIGGSQLWRFYYGDSLKRACNSFQKGGSNTGRKAIKIW